MRYREIIEAGTAGTSTSTAPETWEQRHAAHQRQQAKRAKVRDKLAAATAAAAEQSRSAAAQRARSNDKLAGLHRDLAAAPD